MGKITYSSNPTEMRPEEPGSEEELAAWSSGDLHTWKDCASPLHKLLIAPLTESLAGIDRLWIVPSGHLHYLPFEALWSDGFLIERFSVCRLPSLTLLPHLRLWDPSRIMTVAAFAEPGPVGSRGGLPGTLAEVDAIRSAGWEVTPCVGANINGSQFLEAAGDETIIHIACHASIDTIQPNLSRLYLGDLAADPINVDRIMRGSVAAPLVVLSACSTSFPKIAGGDEVLSLSYAFLYAGASTTIGTLWKVEDRAVAELIREFYIRLRDYHVDRSLQGAQLSLLQSKKYAHPRFWAAFHAVGSSLIPDEVHSTQEQDEANRNIVKGVQHLSGGWLAEAEREFSKACELKPDSLATWVLRGSALTLVGDLEAARACLEIALGLDPAIADTRLKLGIVFMRLGRNEEAEQQLRQAVALDVDNLEALVNLSLLLEERGAYEQALVFADRALALKADCSEAKLNKAIALCGLDRLDESIAWTSEVLQESPASVAAHQNMAMILGRKLNMPGARRHWLKVLELDANNQLARATLTELRKTEAEIGASPISPRADAAIKETAEALERGQIEAAVTLAESATRIAPESHIVWSNYGTGLAAYGKLEAARQALLKSVGFDETDPDVWFNLAYVQFQLGQTQDATASVERALEIDTVFPSALALFCELLVRQGRGSEAIGRFEKALGVAPEPENEQIRSLLQQGRKALRRE